MVSVRRSEVAATRAGAAVMVRVSDAPVALAPLFGRDAIEAEMIECVALTWRLRARGEFAPPFASDGPWHLMVRDRNVGDYDARGGDLDDAPPPRVPLTREDMARIDRAARWLAMLEGRPTRKGQTSAASDGMIVAAVLRQKAGGQSQVDWGGVLWSCGLRLGRGGLRMRYDRAMTWLADRVVMASC